MFCNICGTKIVIENNDIFCPVCTKVIPDESLRDLVRYNVQERFFILDHLSEKIGEIETEMQGLTNIKELNSKCEKSFESLAIIHVDLCNFILSLYNTKCLIARPLKIKIRNIKNDLEEKMGELSEYLKNLPKS